MRTAGLCAWEFRIYFRIEGAGHQGVLGLEGHQPRSWSPNQRPMFDFTMFLGTLLNEVSAFQGLGLVLYEREF